MAGHKSEQMRHGKITDQEPSILGFQVPKHRLTTDYVYRHM